LSKVNKWYYKKNADRVRSSRRRDECICSVVEIQIGFANVMDNRQIQEYMQSGESSEQRGNSF